MSLQPHTLNPNPNARRSSKRLGRGNSSQKGTTAGRGTKGQKARSGGKGGIFKRAMKQNLLKVPKLRGFNSFKTKPQTVTLSTLDRAFESGATVTPEILKSRGIVKDAKSGVKIVSSGSLSKPLTFEGCLASKQAAANIESSGGTIKF